MSSRARLAALCPRDLYGVRMPIMPEIYKSPSNIPASEHGIGWKLGEMSPDGIPVMMTIEEHVLRLRQPQEST